MPYFRYKIVILQWFKTYSFKIMIRRIILTMAFLAIPSLSARDVKSVSLPAADVTDAPHAWTVPPLWSELQGGYRGCREKLIFLWSVKVGLFDPLAPVRQCSCRAYYQKKSCKSFDLQDSVAEREENDHFAATPCIIVFYFFILFNCSHIVATTEYFESTRRYCYPKCALAFLGFKSTKK